MVDSFASHWRDALALDRTVPEFYTSPSDVEPGPHAAAIRFALTDLGLAAVNYALGRSGGRISE